MSALPAEFIFATKPSLSEVKEFAPAYTFDGDTGSTLTDERNSALIPLLKRTQLLPPLMLLNTPPPELLAAAYTVVGAVGSTVISTIDAPGRPVLLEIQLAPPSTLLNNPPLAPA